MVVKVLKKFAGPKVGPFLPKLSPKMGFGNYLNFGSFDMFNIAYCDYFE